MWACPPFEGIRLSTSCKRSRIILQKAADSPAQEKLIDILDRWFLNLVYRFFILNGWRVELHDFFSRVMQSASEMPNFHSHVVDIYFQMMTSHSRMAIFNLTHRLPHFISWFLILVQWFLISHVDYFFSTSDFKTQPTFVTFGLP